MIPNITITTMPERRLGEASDHIRQNAKTIIHQGSKFKELKETNESYSELIQKIDAQTNAERTDISNLQSRIDHLRKTRMLKNKSIEDMNSKVTSKIKQLKEINLKSEDFNTNTKDILGLEITIISSLSYGMSFIVHFHGLFDHKDAECCCEVILNNSVMPQGEFEIVKTSPAIRAKKSRAMEKYLNRTNDLCGFFVTLRKQFLNIISAENCKI